MFHIDYETFSEADLPSVGGWRYASDPSTEILCCAIAKGEQQPLIWVPWPYRSTFHASHDWTAADTLLQELAASNEPVYAHNAVGFEVPITDALWRKTTGLPPIAHSRWRCTAVMARRAALPYSLAGCANKLGLAQKKDGKGGKLIELLSIPQKDGKRIRPTDDPGAFRQFCDYCLQDVRVEQEIHKKLEAFELKGFDLEVFQADLEMNARGLPVNVKAIKNAQKIVEAAAGPAVDEFKSFTGLEPTQGKAFLAWLKERGYERENLRAETIDEFLDSDDCDADGEVGQALQLRQRVSFAATKKLDSFLSYAGPHDNKVRGILMYYGAFRTGRWASFGPQIQNAKKPSKHLEKHTDGIYEAICRGADMQTLEFLYGNPIEAVASCIRHFVDDGKPMLNADYSAIEARILAWMAGELWRLEVFKTHGKIYEASASKMFNIALKDINKDLRGKGKIAELALGFGGSIRALITMGALKMGIPEEDLQGIVDKWRAANPNIKAFWNKCEAAARAAMVNPGQRYGVNGMVQYFAARTAGLNYLFVRLPSGRHLAYPEPRFEMTETPWGDMRESITFYGIPPKKKTFGRVATHGGKLVENVVQGVAADLMANGVVQCERQGYRINALIHDEALAYHDEGQTPERFSQLLTTLPAWAKDIPMDAPGGLVPYYRKD